MEEVRVSYAKEAEAHGGGGEAEALTTAEQS